MVGRFLAGIAALIWNPVGSTYLLLRRADAKDYAAGSWECVTGRVDQGEGFEQALHREVSEEIGAAVHIAFMLGTSHFYRGEPVPENELLGVVYCCTLAGDAVPRLSEEHSEMRWVTAAQADALLREDRLGEAWLRGVIHRAEITRHQVRPSLRSFHRFNGMDTNR